jgi:hypothetical protein
MPISPSDFTKNLETERFKRISHELLRRAGGAYPLEEAATKLGVESKDLLDKIHQGLVLGMMYEDQVIVPKIQIIEDKGQSIVINGVATILAQFNEAKAGAWSALQFLVEPNPTLAGKSPIKVLQERGNTRPSVIHAARSYLGLDEG